MATIVTSGDLSLVIGSDVDGTRTNRVINAGRIADRHKRYSCCCVEKSSGKV